MGWGGKENSAFMWDRRKAWAWEGRRRRMSGSQEGEETKAQREMPLGPPLWPAPLQNFKNLGAEMDDRDGG